jgi:hypothetical protein
VSILLLCGLLLRAAGISKAPIKLPASKKEAIKIKTKKDPEFIPGSVLL